MLSNSSPSVSRLRLSLFALLALCLCGTAARAQDEAKEAVFHEFKGVCIGMSASEARQKLGNPTEKSDALDFYNVADKQIIQVYYEAGKVSAISLMFMNAGADAMTAKNVFGADIEAKPDGSIYKMVRYQKAGYFVAYNRSAGNAPTVSVTIQKIK